MIYSFGVFLFPMTDPVGKTLVGQSEGLVGIDAFFPQGVNKGKQLVAHLSHIVRGEVSRTSPLVNGLVGF